MTNDWSISGRGRHRSGFAKTLELIKFHLRASSMKPKSLQILVSKHGAAVEACFRELSSQSWALPIWFFGRSIVRSVAVVLASKSICYRCLASKCCPCARTRVFASKSCPVPKSTIFCRSRASECRPSARKYDLLPLSGSRNCTPPIACDP